MSVRNGPIVDSKKIALCARAREQTEKKTILKLTTGTDPIGLEQISER